MARYLNNPYNRRNESKSHRSSRFEPGEGGRMPRRKTDSELEADYQSGLIKRLRVLLPNPTIEKFDIRQGYPDLLLLCENWWGVLEVKPYEGADQQPNQDIYVEMFNSMSYGSFIWPEIEMEVLDGLQRSFESSRAARFSKP